MTQQNPRFELSPSDDMQTQQFNPAALTEELLNTISEENTSQNIIPPKKQKSFFEKHKLAVIGGLAVAGGLGLGMILTALLLGGSPDPVSNELVLKEDLTYELGEEIVLKPETLLTPETLAAVEDGTTWTITSPLTNDPGSYSYIQATGEVTAKKTKHIPAGEYDIMISNGEESVSGTLVVEDTQQPDFIATYSTISIEQNAAFDINRYFIAKDLAPVKVECEHFNTMIPGVYSAKVTATDESNNKTETTCTIQVLSQAELQNGMALSEDLTGNVSVTGDTMNKADNGDLYIRIIEAPETAKQALFQTRSTSTHQYSMNESSLSAGGYYMTPNAFTTSQYGSMSDLQMNYKDYRAFVKSGLSLEDYKKSLLPSVEEEDKDKQESTGNTMTTSGKTTKPQNNQVSTKPTEKDEGVSEDNSNPYWQWAQDQIDHLDELEAEWYN